MQLFAPFAVNAVHMTRNDIFAHQAGFLLRRQERVGNLVDVPRFCSGYLERFLESVVGKPRVLLLTAEALLPRGKEYLSVLDQRDGRILI